MPGCSTRPASPGRASAWARPICTSCCATCPAPWASSRSGTVPHAASVKAPGYLDEAAGPFDARVAAALTAGDPGALAALDLAAGERLLAAGVPTWRAVGTALAGRDVIARLHYDDAPFGVGYLVADWVAP